MKLLILLGCVFAVEAQTCGQSSFNQSPFATYIVGGQNANSGDFPWQVGLVESGYLICGGTYITGTDGSVKVVTAAHCITKNLPANKYSVAFGMHLTASSVNRLVIQASSIKVHASYNDRTMSSDIAIISFSGLTHAGLAGTHASPACLASKAYTDGEMAIVSGWGTTSEGGSSSSTLKYVCKPILNYVTCNTNTGNAGDLDATMMCAGEAGKDACQGDSGGPMVAYRNGWELVGVVSWGYGCGQANYPGVYADAFYLKNWILIAEVQSQCGQSSHKPTTFASYIVGGQNANPGEFPWQVGLVESGYLICGGTYITGSDGSVKVVTAAHCITKGVAASSYSVAFGMHLTTSTVNRLVIEASSIAVHKSYNERTMSSDIAIISFNGLTHAGLAGTHAEPACLASRAYTGYTATSNNAEMAVVSGWGTTSEGGSSSTALKFVVKPLLDYTYCNTQTGNAGDLDSTMMCAGETGKDACQGDSGGPMVVYRDNAWELVGVVSWGYGCGRANHPGVYSDAFNLKTWILNNS